MGTHNAVREKYGSIGSEVAATGTAACCSPEMRCCDPITKGLYSADEQGSLPEKAVLASLGCGNPTAMADLHDGMTVLDAVLEVGGLGQFAAGNRARLVRSENGKTTEIKVKLEALVEHGDMTQNLALKPGDVLVVPETRF